MNNELNDVGALKRNQIVELLRPCAPLSGDKFAAGDKMKFLGWYGGYGNLARLSRVGDNAKVTVLPKDIGFGFPAPEQSAPLHPKVDSGKIFDSAHSDESGTSRPVVIATVLAGKDSGTLVMHMTPAEEREYNRGMAMLY